MIRNFAATILLVLCSVFSCFAQSAVSASSANVTASPSSAAGTWKNQPEVIALQEQNNVIKQYHASLLDTVYWALGVVATVSVLLVGAGWLVNFKLYEVDKQRMREEFGAQTATIRAAVEAQIAAARAEALQTVQASVGGFADRVSNEQIALRTELQGAINKLDERVVAIDDQLLKSVQVFKLINKRLHGVEATAREVEEHIWDLRGIPVNVLITEGQGLRAAVKAEDEAMVKAVLERMKETLSTKLIAKNHSLKSSVANHLRSTIETAASLSAVTMNEVLALLDTVVIDGD